MVHRKEILVCWKPCLDSSAFCKRHRTDIHRWSIAHMFFPSCIGRHKFSLRNGLRQYRMGFVFRWRGQVPRRRVLVTLNHLVDFPGRKTHRHGSETSNYKTIRHISEFAVTWYGFVPMSAGRLWRRKFTWARQGEINSGHLSATLTRVVNFHFVHTSLTKEQCFREAWLRTDTIVTGPDDNL